jgi:hypothetical protein
MFCGSPKKSHRLLENLIVPYSVGYVKGMKTLRGAVAKPQTHQKPILTFLPKQLSPLEETLPSTIT